MTATVASNTQAGSIVNFAEQRITTDGVAAVDNTFSLGFAPRYVKWVDLTNRIMLEWFEGMAANSALRTVAAGTRTLDVSSGITLGTAALGTVGQVTIKAADIPISSVFALSAWG
jgi:hypothetical protein